MRGCSAASRVPSHSSGPRRTDGTMPFIRIWPEHGYWDTKAWRTSGASRTRMSSRAFIRTTGAVRWAICPGCAARATRAASSAGWCAAMVRCAGYPGHFRCCPARRGPLFKSCFWILPTDMRFKHGSCITTSAWRVCWGRYLCRRFRIGLGTAGARAGFPRRGPCRALFPAVRILCGLYRTGAGGGRR